jgi:hypothetical protein
MRYKTIHYRRHLFSAAVICFLLPIPLSFSLAFYWSWRYDGHGHYVGFSDTAYLTQLYPQLALRLIVLLRGVCLIVLVTLNVAIVVMFRRQALDTPFKTRMALLSGSLQLEFPNLPCLRNRPTCRTQRSLKKCLDIALFWCLACFGVPKPELKNSMRLRPLLGR